MTQLGTGTEGGDLSFVTRNLGVSGERLRILSSGSVGIGTSSPGANLHVYSPPSVSVDIESNSPTGGGWSRLRLMTKTRTYGWALGDSTESGTPDKFSLYDYTARAFRMTVDTSGNLGVGTTSPAARLHVVGDIRVDGNINAKYQDVAEWVPSRQKLSAGTVVVLDTEHSNQVLASSKAYDTKVAGVVSARPGIALGEAGEGRLLVATTGRVRVRVDATRAPVRVGDLLVTSDVEGVAMRSVPVGVGGVEMHRPGTIVGKALEPLGEGVGEILVLLSLQ